MRRSPTRSGAAGLLVMLAVLSTPSGVTAAAPSATPAAAVCPDVVAAFVASLPASAHQTFAGRPADAWPSFDATTAAMVPDDVLGSPVLDTYLLGVDPTRRWDYDSFDGDEPPIDTLASRLGHAVVDQDGVTADDPRTFHAIMEDPTYHLEILVTRIHGVTGTELLPAIVDRRLAGLRGVTCQAQELGGLPVLLAASGIDRFAFLGYRDAWLVADTTDSDPEGTMGDQPGPWDPERFLDAVTDMATTIAGLPADLPEPSLTASAVGTRITPPARSTDLAAILDAIVAPGEAGLFGEGPGLLGRGMMPGSMLSLFAPLIADVADVLGVDARTLWGDAALGFDIDDADRSIEFFAFIDPSGDGSRWIAPLVGSYRGPTIMYNGVDFGNVDPTIPAPSLPLADVHPMTVGGKQVQGVIHEEFGDTSITVFYASGPYVFLVNSGSEETADQILAELP